MLRGATGVFRRAGVETLTSDLVPPLEKRAPAGRTRIPFLAQLQNWPRNTAAWAVPGWRTKNVSQSVRSRPERGRQTYLCALLVRPETTNIMYPFFPRKTTREAKWQLRIVRKQEHTLIHSLANNMSTRSTGFHAEVLRLRSPRIGPPTQHAAFFCAKDRLPSFPTLIRWWDSSTSIGVDATLNHTGSTA